ncbi:MAG: hypothetical protein COW01_02295 [Bdellovibrionales bacterium CG12_big_fil_rev_8_21_14_0_65_38_15]|nr:MAG: hypothetical protein COW79_02530 [Bdellovibrionales bacterium CG22_combo_CG10-13_8_21_14_all_38_13]PIQ57137.1 MAG: hypothetical protein COW01_02295 [Bdellovibrionales bacterium CG12_big_fil_rev_8_21_14_0_65_38_15]PIR30167.1 MAG: hypothetical protein COV38_07690 [Bdellovibrionales bacterium CG11_big_fil_rev_8_21_14_0_20_38_13]
MIRFDGDAVNIYRYVNNDPVNLIDPSGLQDRCPADDSGRDDALDNLLNSTPEPTPTPTYEQQVEDERQRQAEQEAEETRRRMDRKALEIGQDTN